MDKSLTRSRNNDGESSANLQIHPDIFPRPRGVLCCERYGGSERKLFAASENSDRPKSYLKMMQVLF